MPTESPAILALNRGLMSKYAVARLDLKRTALASEVQVNWDPQVLGPMSLRPGLEYLGTTYNNVAGRNIPFVFSSTDTALIELTDSLLRVRISDALLTRPSVATAVTNGTFASDLSGWTDADETSSTSAWVTGYMSLIGSGNNYAIRTQTLSVAVNDRNVEHGLHIIVARGPVTLRVGSTSGGDEYITERDLKTGTHSLAFTPTGASVYLRLMNRRKAASLVDSVTIEAAGVMTLPTPWAAADLPDIRFTQSADVVFVCDGAHTPRRIERWSARSWAIVNYEPEAGPFRVLNTTRTTITPSDISGDITLTASKNLFKATHVGALFKFTSVGQLVEVTLTGANQWSEPIAVTAVGGERRFSIVIYGGWSATITLQYSVAEVGNWVDVQTWTSNVSRAYTDDLDGQIIYYRIGIDAGDYTSGTATASLSASSGTLNGVARVTAYTNQTAVSASVIDELGSIAATTDWYEGTWSDYRGWPSSVTLHEGRLWWFGKGYAWGSESDDYEGFDDEVEGDAGPIQRSIGEGPVDSINWALNMQRLIIGTASAEISIRSSSLDEPLTPTNFSMKAATTQGSRAVDAQRIDSIGIFVQATGRKVFMLDYNVDKGGFAAEDLTALVPDLNEAGIEQLAVQRQPYTRLHARRADGTVAILTFDEVEEVKAWWEFETDGDVEDVCVVPGAAAFGEDQVYYIVKRTIDGSTVRYVEKWAMKSECRGGALNKQADSFYEYSGASTSTITGLDHLEGETVVVWGSSKDLGSYTVSGGAITLTEAVTSCIVGLEYEARYKSMKLGDSDNFGIPLNRDQRISHIGLILLDTHVNGLEYGPSFTTMSPLPAIEDEAEVTDDYVWNEYSNELIEFEGEWTTDARVCLRATAPRPCTVAAIRIEM